MQIISADNVPLGDILAAMMDAYSDYVVPMQMDLAAFEKMLGMRGYDPALSLLAVEADSIASFWLTGLEPEARPGKAYAATVGTRIAHRRKGLVQQLFAELAARARELGLAHVLLEVVEDNDKAVQLYEGLGFDHIARVECFKGSPPDTNLANLSFQSASVQEVHDAGATFCDWRPSWQNDTPAMANAGDGEDGIDATLVLADSQVLGIGMISKTDGRIAQIAIDPRHRRKGIARALTSYWAKAHDLETMTILNIPDTDKATTSFFRALDWENHVNQFVMQATL